MFNPLACLAIQQASQALPGKLDIKDTHPVFSRSYSLVNTLCCLMASVWRLRSVFSLKLAWVHSQNKAQWLAACGHVSAGSQSLRFLFESENKLKLYDLEASSPNAIPLNNSNTSQIMNLKYESNNESCQSTVTEHNKHKYSLSTLHIKLRIKYKTYPCSHIMACIYRPSENI